MIGLEQNILWTMFAGHNTIEENKMTKIEESLYSICRNVIDELYENASENAEVYNDMLTIIQERIKENE